MKNIWNYYEFLIDKNMKNDSSVQHFNNRPNILSPKTKFYERGEGEPNYSIATYILNWKPVQHFSKLPNTLSPKARSFEKGETAEALVATWYGG